VQQKVRDMTKKLAHTASTALHAAEITTIEMADIRKQYRGKKAASNDRWIISRARVINGAAVAKAREEKASQAAAWAEVKEQRTAVQAEVAKNKATHTVSTKTKGGGKVVAVTDVPDVLPKKSHQLRKVLVILKVYLSM